MADSLLTSNFDILFLILSFLPTETLLLVKSVCRSWAKVISDPAFARAHCSRPTPIAAFFVLDTSRRDKPVVAFRKVIEDAKFPNSISTILSDNFSVVSGNHGLLCFHRKRTFRIGNPVTSQWVDVRDTIPSSGYGFHGAALLYDPETSLHFKLAVAMIRFDEKDNQKHYIRFHIYSSENSSWAVSSVYTIQSQHHRASEKETQISCNVYKPSKVGGGSVCWIGESATVVGYEIATDTYWKTKPCSDGFIKTVSGYNGIIYYITCTTDARVWRLEEKRNWVFVGECCCRRRMPCPFAYDDARRALILAAGVNAEVIAMNLESSRSEVLCPIFGSIGNVFNLHHMPHANTLAPFY